MKKTPRWYLNPFTSPKDWVLINLNIFRNFIHASLHPRLIKKNLRSYLQVMKVYHRCTKAFRENHQLVRKNQNASLANWGQEEWMKKKDEAEKRGATYDPNWDDLKMPRNVPCDEDDRCDSDPPKRRQV
jgi:hypothetical protein